MLTRAFVISFFAIVLCATAFAFTPQWPNTLIFEGKEYPIDVDPMAVYFEKHPDSKPKIEDRNSALWRGYIADFEFRGNDLFLKDLRVFDGMEQRGEYYYRKWKSVLKESVGDTKGLKIDWLSGLVVSGYGDNYYADAYDIIEYRDHYAKYTIFEIQSGVLTGHRDFDNKGFLGFRNNQFEAFKKTPEYIAAFNVLAADDRFTKEANEGIIKAGILAYSKKFLVP